jgi:hypothetical protein
MMMPKIETKSTLVLSANVIHVTVTYIRKKMYETAFGAKKACTPSAGEELSAAQLVATT